MSTDVGAWTEIGSQLVWLVILSGFALLGAGFTTVLHARQRSVSPMVLILGAAFAALLVIVTARGAVVDWADLSPSDRVTAVTTFGATYVLGALSVVPAFLTTWIGGAWVGATDGPLRWPLAGGVVVVALIAGAPMLAAGVDLGSVYAWIRYGAYALGGGLVAATWLAALSPKRGGAEAVAASSALFPLWVAVGEASERGLAQLLMVRETANIRPDRWADAVAWMLDQVANEGSAGRMALGIASLIAVAGAVRARSWGAAAAAAVGIGLAWVLLASAELGAGRLNELAGACQGVAP